MNLHVLPLSTAKTSALPSCPLIQQNPINQPCRHVVWEPMNQMEELTKLSRLGTVRAPLRLAQWGHTVQILILFMELRLQGMRPGIGSDVWAQ